MKNLTLLSVFILSISVLIPATSQTQNQPQSKSSSTWWIGADLGRAHNNIDNNRLGGRMFSMNFNYNTGIHLFTLQGSGISTQHAKRANLGNVFAANFISYLFTGKGVKTPAPVYTKSKYSVGSLMYGLITRPSTLRFYASSGISWVSGHGNYRSDSFSEIGLPIKCGMLISTKNIGLGINYFHNINSYSNYSGIAFSIQVGVNK